MILNTEGWFVDSKGGLLDPQNIKNINIIEDNIKKSIRLSPVYGLQKRENLN